MDAWEATSCRVISTVRREFSLSTNPAPTTGWKSDCQATSRTTSRTGSIALNGISLTVAEVLPESFAVWIIPHTRRQTNLKGIAPGDFLNVEFDLLAKYVERMLNRYAPHN